MCTTHNSSFIERTFFEDILDCIRFSHIIALNSVVATFFRSVEERRGEQPWMDHCKTHRQKNIVF
jgi:hypothetical protein